MGTSSTRRRSWSIFFLQGLCQSERLGAAREKRGQLLLAPRAWICAGIMVHELRGGRNGGFCFWKLRRRSGAGWRYAFYVPAAALLGVWVSVFPIPTRSAGGRQVAVNRNYHREPVDVLEPGEAPDEEPEGSWKVIREAATNRWCLLLGFVYFCLKPTRYAVLFWGPKYIYERLGTGMAEAGFPELAIRIGRADQYPECRTDFGQGLSVPDACPSRLSVWFY